MRSLSWHGLVGSSVALLFACGDDGGGSGTSATGVTGATSLTATSTATEPTTGAPPTSATGDASSTTAEDSTGAPTPTSSATGGPLLDVGVPDLGGPGECAAEQHAACDAVDGDPLQAIGLNCPGELTVTGGFDGNAAGLRVLSQWGQADTFTPREGSSFLVLSTGDLDEMHDVPADEGDVAYHCNSWFEPGDGMDTTKFPPPITKQPVQGDCLVDPSLVGTGDCSKTIKNQFEQSGFKYDYQELRFTAVVPPGAESFSFDLAFFTKEYPTWKNQPYNDMFVGWLESTHWTGNISFDQQGKALSLNAAFLELYDDAGDLPEFAGTCMRYSAGTKWLTTTADVVPGETIELVLAIFDLDDVNWDSFVLVDNFQWHCGDAGGPVTEPVG
ncbi:choice-of-anchor L domain-containing protein [Nannocystis punicea]|uniref:Choice-of-anchor L domain-containing protein n=1 Tax=Nannocystis punicea TaxID=2995304 RepID=A0ABY7HFG5_9BACT|nr:choice-of-anchor L domain-containing protein [Nannocystis poenicansa]WAS98025.1 choice-of-anchor L domain-containing protein [Nannocystis poenicansa]